jgi:hypothetical protein
VAPVQISDSKGRLQYIPFPTCNETGQPLRLPYGLNQDLNCTIAFIPDPFFHLLEFYIHNDVPLTCRIPSNPPTTITADVSSPITPGGDNDADGSFIPLTFALTGKLQLSHLHVSNHLNVIVHADGGRLDSAVAYSVSGGGRGVRIVIGDELPFRFSVRWVEGVGMPSGTNEGVSTGRLAMCWWVVSLPQTHETQSLTNQNKKPPLSPPHPLPLHHLLPPLRAP